MHVAPVEAIDDREQVASDAVAGRRSRSARRPTSPADFQLVADVDLGRRIVADEHDAEPRRAARRAR